MWERGPIGSNGACSTLCWFSVTPSATHNQIGPFWCCFLGGCVCVRSRSLWVSPTNSPLRLGFSPAAAQPPQVFSVSGLRLYFPTLEPWVGSIALSASCCLAGSFLCPGCPSLPLLLVWMYVSFLSTWCRTSLSFDFLSVLVVRGGAVCLPMPPSWSSLHHYFFKHVFYPLLLFSFSYPYYLGIIPFYIALHFP